MYVEVSGTISSRWDGIYRITEAREHGYPVYQGPGDTALSWANGHWWLTPASEVGVNNGYGYLHTQMRCPGNVESHLIRGGSDEEIEGTSVKKIDVDLGEI